MESHWQSRDGDTDRLEHEFHLFILFVFIFNVAAPDSKLGIVFISFCRRVVF